MQPPVALPTDSSKAIVAVHERLQYQLLAAMTAYSARYGALPADAYAKLTKIDDHLWPMPKRGLAEATEFIRDHGARHGIAPFDDEAKAILHAAYGQGGVLDAKWETHDKLDRRKANRLVARFLTDSKKGRRSAIDKRIAEHQICVVEDLTGRAVRVSRHPHGSTSSDGTKSDGKPHGLHFEILLDSLRLAQWRAAFRTNPELRRCPEKHLRSLPTAEALACFIRDRQPGEQRQACEGTWVSDADIRRIFDATPDEWLINFIENNFLR